MMRQELIFIKDWHKPGIVPKARPIHLAQKPDRIWTLYHNNPHKRPRLPFSPHHNVNAFSEDYIHDWNWHSRNGGTFDYFSRVADRPVWVLLEYEE